MIKTAAETALSDALAKLTATSAVRALREKALREFAERGLPHRRVEEWKYTDLRALLREMAPLAGTPDKAALAEAKKSHVLSNIGAREIVFVNGSFVPELSDLKSLGRGLSIMSLGDALAKDAKLPALLGELHPGKYDAVFALNTAALNEGLVIEVAPGAQITRPIHVRHVFAGVSPLSTFGRVVVKVGKKAQATLLQSYTGPDAVAYQSNVVTQISVDADADLDLVRLQAEGDKAIHLSMLIGAIGEQTRLRTFALSTGAATARHTMPLAYAGKDARALIAGATLLRGKQHNDTTLESRSRAAGRREPRTLQDRARR